MSVQVAKSTSGTTPTAGRRTPLSLGSVGKSAKTQLPTDTEKDKSKSEVSSNTSTTPNSKAATKNDKNENSTTDLKKINDKSDKKNANSESSTENTNSAKEKGSDNKKKDDKSKDKDSSSKKDDKKQENGLNEGKESSKTNGHKDEDKKAEKAEKSDKLSGPKESARKKDIKEQKEQEQKETKLDEKISETKKVDEKKSSGKNEESEQKQSKKKTEVGTEKQPKDEKEKDPENKKKPRKEPETPKKDENKSREADSVTPTKDVAQKPPICNQSISSLAVEKDLKGFTPEGDEMESLVFDSESDTNGGPAETSTPGKILKIKQSPPSSVQKTTYEHRETYEKYESVSIKEDKPDMPSATATPLERPQFTSSYRAISGRRSLRPARDYSFQGTYRESYRKINTELDYTSSSMNVTVGSEIPNECSFSIFGRGKKRERTPPVTSSNDSNIEVQMDVELSPKSPKRARLDFSGILGIVASPVTLLRAKLSKTKIQSSTPNGKVTSTTKDDEDGVENVSVIASEEMASNDIADASEDVIIEDAESAEKDINDEFKDDSDIEISENLDDFKKPQPVTASIENVNKRRMCNVM